MQERTRAIDANMVEARAMFNKLPFGEWLDKYGMYMITGMQSLVDRPTWMAAYDTAKAEGNTDEKAAAIANRAVADIMGSPRNTSISPAMRDQVVRLIMMFGSYANTVLNQNMLRARQFALDPSPKTAFEAGWTFLLTIMVANVAYEGIKMGLQDGDFGPDDESDEGMLAWLTKYTAAQMANMVPLGRELVAGAEGRPVVPLAFRPIISVGRLAGKLLDEDAPAPTIKEVGRAAQALPFIGPAAAAEQWIRMADALNNPDSTFLQHFVGVPASSKTR